ncbi:MAG: hypothetical protein C5B52_10485 [Bacteroidetes bacterium]|nr:MAG: hypothetical protein C5B52_10485 [Bacteroidota bacterium]
MVTADVAQLSRECNTWREALRSQREDFAHLNHELQQAAASISDHESLIEVERYQNQFHIQLINIHDLKHAIKSHEKKANLPLAINDSRTYDEVITDHEKLHDEYMNLEHTLQELKSDFHFFLEHTH